MRGTGDTTRYVIDSSAWIELLEGTPRGDLVRGILADEQNDIFTSMLSVAEVVSVVERSGRSGRRAAEALESASVLVALDFTLAVSAGLIHAERRGQSMDFPYGDAAVVATAKTLRARIVTFDRHFEGQGDILFLDET